MSLSRDCQASNDESCNDTEFKLSQKLINLIRPKIRVDQVDICFDVCWLSTFMKSPQAPLILKASKIL